LGDLSYCKDERGRGATKHKVFVAVSKNDKGNPLYLKMQVVSNLKDKTISKFAEKNIVYGNTVQSDAYRSYRKPLTESYLHEYQIFDSSDVMQHCLHTIIAKAKALVAGAYHGLGGKHLQVYLDEFCYRFSLRFRQGELFNRFLFATSQSIPLRFVELT
jgi:hypothetical protein